MIGPEVTLCGWRGVRIQEVTNTVQWLTGNEISVESIGTLISVLVYTQYYYYCCCCYYYYYWVLRAPDPNRP